MGRKETIMEMRVNRLLKGKKPCYVYLRQNNGQIYEGGQSDFIMTITDNFLHFQKLSFSGGGLLQNGVLAFFC